jgi:hypothetical protein
MLVKDVHKRTRRQSRASSRGATPTTPPAGHRSLPATGAAADPARLARFILQQQQSQQSLLRSSSSPRQAPVSDSEAPRDAGEYRLVREVPSRRGRRRIDPSLAAPLVDEMLLPGAVRFVPGASVAGEEEEDGDAVVEPMDVGLGTVVV